MNEVTYEPDKGISVYSAVSEAIDLARTAQGKDIFGEPRKVKFTFNDVELVVHSISYAPDILRFYDYASRNRQIWNSGN
jgi:hypothetical protein